MYYLTQSSNRREPLFGNDTDYGMLETFLVQALERNATSALAYCWLPHTLHLAVQCDAIPVGRFMQGFTGRYARYVHGRTGESGHLFGARFQSILLEPAWSPELVRFIHHAPVRAGLSGSAAEYSHSSHAAYQGSASIDWIETQPAVGTLQRRGLSPKAAQRLLSGTPSPGEITVFSSRVRSRARVVGDGSFLRSLPRGLRPPSSRLTLDQLIDIVARSQARSRADILSASRERQLALCRALIAWHAMERRIASLTEISRVLGRDVSTLSKAITRHRASKPELFRLDALSHFWPLA